MSVTIIAIDSFDHTPYANPAVVASGLSHPRQALFFNITSRQASRQDRRVMGQTGAKYKAFSSGDMEPYQYLMLSDHPLAVPAGHTGYAARKSIAEQRYANWQMDVDDGGDNTSALEILHFERFAGLLQPRPFPISIAFPFHRHVCFSRSWKPSTTARHDVSETTVSLSGHPYRCNIRACLQKHEPSTVVNPPNPQCIASPLHPP